MIHGQRQDLSWRQVGRPLLLTVITTLRRDLPPVAVGMAVERILLELEAQIPEEAHCDELYWSAAYQNTLLGILQELQGKISEHR